MNWKASLDRYLTTPPPTNVRFDDWCDTVINKFSDKFYDENENWITDYSGLCNTWLNNLYGKSKSPEETVLIIERAFNIYITIREANDE